MASTYSNLGIELIADGEKPADWGWITNENFEYFDVAIAGSVSIALTSATEALAITDGVASNARNMYITFTGTPGATCVVTVGPNTFEKLYFFQNDTNETVTITQGSGGDVDILTGNAAVVHCNGAGSGAKVVDITDSFVSYTHPTHNGDDISIATTALTGATIFDDIDLVVTTDTLGHVTAASGSTSTRELTLANLGYTGTTDANTYVHPDHSGQVTSTADGAQALAITAITAQTDFTGTLASTDEVIFSDAGVLKKMDISIIEAYMQANMTALYTHPSHTARTEGLDTGALSGATVISDLDFNLSSDTSGHVTACEFTSATTRELTLADLSYTGTTDANTYVHPDHSGQVTSAADGAQSLAVTAISAQTSTSTVADTDEMIINDGGALRKVAVSDLGDHFGGGEVGAISATLENQSGGGTEVVVFTSTDVNTIAGASLSSGTFTLPAGTYFFSSQGSAYTHSGSAVSSLTVAIKLYLYNLADTVYLQTGPMCAPRDSTYNGSTVKYIEAVTSISGVFTLAAEKTIQVRAYSTSQDIDDLAVSFIKLA